ncbi:MAG: 30S ribosomal protein S8 [Patescibacteria group bacterium]
MGDPIADMLNRIRNAQAVGKETVEVPFSAMKFSIAKILEQKGFVKNVEFRGRKVKKIIEIRLRYDDKLPRITGVKRISKPGQRIYTAAQDIQTIKRRQGILILSTSKGFMTDQEARKEKIGGEVFCEIW